MINRIVVNIKSVYGKDLIYPVDDNSRRFVRLAGKKTLSKSDLITIESLGFEIEYTKKVFIDLS